MKAVYWCVTTLCVVALVCVTVLAALGRSADELIQVLTLVVAPSISLIVLNKVDKVEKNTNGHLTDLARAAGIPKAEPARTTDE